MGDEDTFNYSNAFTAFRRAIVKFSNPDDLSKVPWVIKNGLDAVLRDTFRDRKTGKKAQVNRAWHGYFKEIRPKLPNYITPDISEDGTHTERSVRKLRDKWGPNSTEKPDIAYAAYYCAHISENRDLRDAALSIDKTVFGDTFCNVFDAEMPVTNETAEELEKTIHALWNSKNANEEAVTDKFPEQEASRHLKEVDNQRLDPPSETILAATFKTDIELPPTYQYEREEFLDAKVALLPEAEQSARVAVTASVYGAGGYGKTALAGELCLDTKVQAAFPGGIYWLQFGLVNSGVEQDRQHAYTAKDAIVQMLRDAEYPTDSHQLIDLTNDKKAVKSLTEVLPAEPMLIIADDLWTSSQADALSDLPDHISLLATTRVQGLKPRFDVVVKIKKLGVEDSYALLVSDLDKLEEKPLTDAQETRLRIISDSFHGWPLLLQLANSVFKIKLDDGMSIETILSDFETFATLEDVAGWDAPEPGQEENEKRENFVGYCIEAGLKALPDDSYSDALYAMGVFPEDTDIPFSVISDYWRAFIEDRDTNNERKKGILISSSKADTIRRQLNNLSYFRDHNSETETLTIHDVFLAYFRRASRPRPLNELHGHLVTSFKTHCPDGLSSLPAEHKYGWTHLLYHLEARGKNDEVDDLRTDYTWLKGKLHAVGALELQHSFLPLSEREDARDVGRAINLSLPVLRKHPESLAHQMYGRLGHNPKDRANQIVDAAKIDREFYLRPLRPHLLPLGSEMLRMAGHEGPVRCAVFSPDNQDMLTASNDGTARLWSGSTGEELKRFVGHEASINSATFGQDSRSVLTASEDGTARLWSVETEKEIHRFTGHNSAVNDATFDCNFKYVLTASSDGSSRLWSVDSGKELRRFSGYRDTITSARFCKNGTIVLVASGGGSANIWSVDTGELVATFEGHNGWIGSAEFNTDASIVITSSEDKTARLWSVETGEELRRFHVDGPGILHASLDARGEAVVTVAHGGVVQVWSAKTGVELRRYRWRVGWMRSAKPDQCGEKILTASTHGTASIWSVASGLEVQRFSSHAGWVHTAALNSTEDLVITGSTDRTARLWKVTDDFQSNGIAQHGSRINSIEYNSVKNQLLTSSSDGTARLFCAESGTELQRFVGHSKAVLKAIFVDSVQQVLTLSWDASIRLWCVKTGDELKSIPDKVPLFLPTGILDENHGRVLTCRYDSLIMMWSLASGKVLWDVFYDSDKIISAQFDDSGSRIIVCFGSGVVRILSAKSGEEQQMFKISEGWVESAVINCDESLLFAVLSDGTARLCSASNGEELQHYGLKNTALTSACFNRAGDQVFTTSRDCSVRVWSLETGDLTSQVYFDVEPVCICIGGNSVAFGDEGGRYHPFWLDDDAN